MWSLPAWIVEGEPTWAMVAVVPAADAVIMGNKWSPYVNDPTTVYVNRSYDAIGVYGHLGDFAGDQAVWPKLLPILKIAIGGNSTDAFSALLQGNQIQYFTSWGSSYFLVSGNTPWTMIGPGSPPTTGPAPTAITVDSQTNEALSPAGPYQGELFQLSGSADILIVSLLTGYGRLHDSDFALNTALDVSGPLMLCLKTGGCTCPDGSPGASLSTQRATLPLSIGINGGETTAQVGVVGRSLDQYCKKPQENTQPQPAPGGAGGGGGGGGGGDNNNQPTPPPPDGGTSWGDTHLVTLDGLAYNFQVVGEYTLVRSTKDDFLVQVRQVPVLGPKVASVNQAVATRIGGQRVTFTMLNGAAVMRVDGKVISGELAKLKAGSLTGGTTAYGGTHQLTWPDGSVVRVEQLGRYALNVKVTPAASRRGSLEGLLGNFDGSPDNDLIGKSNVKLGRSFTRDDINGSLAEAWRVSQATSLFDYEPGQSTATFIDPTFPAKNLDVAGLANRETAEKTCREDGITDQRLLNDCILDLAATGEFIFGSRYAYAQQVLAARAALNAPAGAAPKLATLWLSGEILDSKSQPEFHFNANKGDVIWVHDPDCTDRAGEQYHPMFLLLFDPSGQRVGDGQGCQFGRVELLATGTYTFKAQFRVSGRNYPLSHPDTLRSSGSAPAGLVRADGFRDHRAKSGLGHLHVDGKGGRSHRRRGRGMRPRIDAHDHPRSRRPRFPWPELPQGQLLQVAERRNVSVSRQFLERSGAGSLPFRLTGWEAGELVPNDRVFPWVFEKRRPAAVTAEIIRNARVIFDVQGIGAAHGHSAHRIDEHAGRGCAARNRRLRVCSRGRLALTGSPRPRSDANTPAIATSAISPGVFAPASGPAGACRRASCASSIPRIFITARSLSAFRRLAIMSTCLAGLRKAASRASSSP